MPDPSEKPFGRFIDAYLSWLTLVVCLSVTGVIYLLAEEAADRQAKAQFALDQGRVEQALVDRLALLHQVLLGAASFTEMLDEVNQSQWNEFVARAYPAGNYSGLLAIGYLGAAESLAIGSGSMGEALWPLPALRRSGLPGRSQLIYPLDGSLADNVPEDLQYDPLHREAMVYASEHSSVGMTSFFPQYRPATGEVHQRFFILYVPVILSGIDSIIRGGQGGHLDGSNPFVFCLVDLGTMLDDVAFRVNPLLGVRAEEIQPGATVAGLTGWEDSAAVSERLQTTFQVNFGGRSWWIQQTGSEAYLHASKSTLPLTTLGLGGMVSLVLFLVVLLLKRAQKAELMSEGRFRALTEQNPHITLIIGEQGKYRYISPSTYLITGLDRLKHDQLNDSDFFHPDDLPTWSQAVNRALQLDGITIPLAYLRVRHKSGKWIELDGALTSMRQVKGVNGVVANLRKAAEMRQINGELKRLAYYDSLTGLANRVLFKDRLDHAIRTCKRRSQKAALLFIDLDGFKAVNDTFGHEAGDRLLRHVGIRLTGCVRQEDSVGRLGGDEFTILLAEVKDQLAVTQVTRNIVRALQAVFLIEGQQVRISASVGIVMIPEDGDDTTHLMKYADLAMYRAKQSDDVIHVFFQDLAAENLAPGDGAH